MMKRAFILHKNILLFHYLVYYCLFLIQGLDVLEAHFIILLQAILSRAMSSFNFSFLKLLTPSLQVFLQLSFAITPLSAQLSTLLQPWIVWLYMSKQSVFGQSATNPEEECLDVCTMTACSVRKLYTAYPFDYRMIILYQM